MTTLVLDYKGDLNYVINRPFTLFSNYKRERFCNMDCEGLSACLCNGYVKLHAILRHMQKNLFRFMKYHAISVRVIKRVTYLEERPQIWRTRNALLCHKYF